jgi:hypothetical protein
MGPGDYETENANVKNRAPVIGFAKEHTSNNKNSMT